MSTTVFSDLDKVDHLGNFILAILSHVGFDKRPCCVRDVFEDRMGRHGWLKLRAKVRRGWGTQITKPGIGMWHGPHATLRGIRRRLGLHCWLRYTCKDSTRYLFSKTPCTRLRRSGLAFKKAGPPATSQTPGTRHCHTCCCSIHSVECYFKPNHYRYLAFCLEIIQVRTPPTPRIT
jgi:hypothetical protein